MKYCILPDNQEKVHYNILCESHFRWKTDAEANTGKPQKEKNAGLGKFDGFVLPTLRELKPMSSPAPSFAQPSQLLHLFCDCCLPPVLTQRESQLTPGCLPPPTHGQQAATDDHTSDCRILTGRPTMP